MKKKDRVILNNPEEIYVEYHRRYLWNFLLNLYKWEGLPDSINVRFLNDKLITDGYAPVFRYADGNLVCTDGAISGIDWYYRPTTFQSVNPVLKKCRRKIYYKDNPSENAAVICYNTGEYQTPESMNTMVEIFAWKLAQIDLSMDTSIMNSRVCLIPVVDDDKEAIRTEKVIKQMYEGKPSVLAYKTAFGKGIEIVPISAKSNIVTPELEDAKRNVFTEFLTRLGVNCIALDKKERTNLVEMNSNDQELYINGNVYLNARKEFCELLKDAFGIDVTVEIDKEVVKEGLIDVSMGLSGNNQETSAQSELGE